MPSIHLLMLTYDRLDYTRAALDALLADPTESFQLTIWDNASRVDTRDYLQTLTDDRIQEVVFSPENLGQADPFNKVFGASRADLIGKVDNDCVVTPGWTRSLAAAHEDSPEIGIVGCWPFSEQDLDTDRARWKIQTFGGHRILRHPWMGGSGLLIKRDLFDRYGPCPDIVSRLSLKIASGGSVNGWYLPLILQDHLDDPLNTPRRAGTEGIPPHQVQGSVAHANGVRWRAEILRNIHDDPFDAKYYSSIRGRAIRRARVRLRR